MLVPCKAHPSKFSPSVLLPGAHVLFALALILTLVSATFADRLHLSDGTAVEVDEAWEDAQGIWYRRGGVTSLIERARVHSIERHAPRGEANIAEGKQVAKLVVMGARSNPEVKLDDTVKTVSSTTAQPVWIYLVGGARVEVDEATETADGVWYRRGNLSIFLERSRIDRIEREPQELVAAPSISVQKERGWSTGNVKTDLLIRQNGARYGVDPYLIFCVMEQESHFNSRALSSRGAHGLMQLMPGTSARFGVRRPDDPGQNIMGGTRYLKELLGKFNGRVDLVLASYNAGEGAVMKYGHRVPPYRETRNYVEQISRRYRRHTNVAAANTAVAVEARWR